MTRPIRKLLHATAWAALVVTAWALPGNAAATSPGSPPSGEPAPARLVGLYAAHFTGSDEQTSGTWNLRIGPGHHLKIWNRVDPIDNRPSFEAGPVSFRGNRMVFARSTAEGICAVGATYTWTLHGGLLRFRLLGEDGCRPRVITFTPHPWRRAP
jgi:hypothetical protein